MHSKQNLADMYENKRYTEPDRKSLSTIKNLLLFFWVLNLILLIYVAYRLWQRFEPFLVVYLIFSIIALAWSLLYWLNSWLGNNILAGFILVLFIIISTLLFLFALCVELLPIKALKQFKSSNSNWFYSILTILAFLIPFLHSVMIIVLWWKRRSAEAKVSHRVVSGKDTSRSKKPKGRLSLSYKPQLDDDTDREKNLFHGHRNMT